MVQSLPVHMFGTLVGEIDHDRGRLGLRYVDSSAPAIGRRLPVRDVPYTDEECRGFIANLLPEGDWRGALCRRLALPGATTSGYLRSWVTTARAR